MGMSIKEISSLKSYMGKAILFYYYETRWVRNDFLKYHFSVVGFKRKIGITIMVRSQERFYRGNDIIYSPV